jgi:ankyrin repeat protein
MGLFSKREKGPADYIDQMKDAITGADAHEIRNIVARGGTALPVAGYNPLFHAISRNSEDSVRALLGLGADPNSVQGGETMLGSALEGWRHGVAGLLLDAGANPNTVTGNGMLPLRRVLKKGWSDVALRIVDAGADVTVRDEEGLQPLQRAVRSGFGPGLIRKIASHGADVNAQAPDGTTALHDAAKSGNAALVIALLELGADETIADNENRTPAALAQNDHPGIAAVLRGERPGIIRQDNDNGWKLLAADEVARVTQKNAVGYRVTEIFNFTARLYTQVMRNLSTGQESQAVKAFSAVAEGGLVAEAAEALARLGGNAPAQGMDKKKLAMPGQGPA